MTKLCNYSCALLIYSSPNGHYIWVFSSYFGFNGHHQIVVKYWFALLLHLSYPSFSPMDD